MEVEKLERKIEIKTQRFRTNKLLNRVEMSLDIKHEHLASPSKALIKKKLMEIYEIQDSNKISIFAYKSKYGNGHSIAKCCIYNTHKLRKKVDSKHHLWKDKLLPKREVGTRVQRRIYRHHRRGITGRATR